MGTLRKCFLLVSSSLSLVDEGRELNEESPIGSTLEMLSQRLSTGSLLSDNLTFSSEDIIGSKMGGNLKSLLVDVECEASVSCEALRSEKFTRLSEGLRAVELLCNLRTGLTLAVSDFLIFVSLLLNL